MSDKQKANKQTRTAAQIDRPSKTIFQTESPFTVAEWPALDKRISEPITELLRDLLDPIGHYRAAHLKESRPRSQRKRKRKSSNITATDSEPNPPESHTSPPPPPPQILSQTLIGYNTVIRHLQHLTQPTHKSSSEEESPSTSPKAILVIFVTGNPTWPPYAELSLLAALASQQLDSAIRLVLLDSKSEDVLAEALGVGRVGVVGVVGLLDGVEEVSGGKGLMELVRGSMDIVRVPWKDELERVSRGAWLVSSVGVVSKLDHPQER